MRLMGRPFFKLSSALLIAMVGMTMVGDRAWDHMLWEERMQWSTTTGIIESSRSLKPTKEVPGGIGGGRAKVKDHVTLTFTYSVNAQKYQSKRFTYSVSGNSIPREDLINFRSLRQQESDSGTTKIQVTGVPKTGDEVNVWYKADAPQFAVLHIGKHFRWRGLTLFIGAFLILFGIVFILKTWCEG